MYVKTARPGGRGVLPPPLRGPDGERECADDQQNAKEHAAGRVIGLPVHDGGDADGGEAERVGKAGDKGFMAPRRRPEERYCGVARRGATTDRDRFALRAGAGVDRVSSRIAQL